MKLEDLTEISIGILVKRERKETGENRYKLFSLKNYEEKLEFEEIRTEKKLDNSISKEGDLLFRLVYPNKIILIDRTIQGLLIPSQFCIIRTKKIRPIVLKWYLESQKVREELEIKASNSIIKNTKVSSIRKLEIPEIEEEKQKDMEKLIKLWEKEKEIHKKILNDKEKLYNFYLEKMIQKGE